MALRWYGLVIDSHDIAAQARWWADALGWKVEYESESECWIGPPHGEGDRDRPWTERTTAWCFVPVPEAKSLKNRLHVDLAPHSTDDQAAEVDRLLGRGARLADVGQPSDASFIVMADPEGNEFCILSARDE